MRSIDDPVVVVVPGTPNSRLLAPGVDVAERLGIGVVSIDRPGYGNSSARARWRWSDSGRLAVAVLDRLGVDRVGVVGWSAGGGHALAAAAELGERCRGVGLVAPVASVDDRIARRAMAQGRQLAVLRRLPPTLRRAVLTRALGPTAGRAAADPEARWHQLLGRASAADRSVLSRPEVEAVVRADIAATFAQREAGWVTDAVLLAQPWPRAWSSLTCPVRIWHGTDDDEVPPVCGRAVAARLPSADLRAEPGAGHYLLFDRWDEVLAFAAAPG